MEGVTILKCENTQKPLGSDLSYQIFFKSLVLLSTRPPTMHFTTKHCKLIFDNQYK